MDHIDALLNCVNEQSALLSDFIDLLETEGELLLESPSNEALSALTIRKNDYARQLADLDKTRAAALAGMALPDSREGIEAVCTDYPDIRPAFHQLFDRAEQAQALNLANGQTLQAFMDQNQQAMNTLGGLMGQDLYDARGRLPKK